MRNSIATSGRAWSPVPGPHKYLGRSPRWLASEFDSFVVTPTYVLPQDAQPGCEDLQVYFHRVLINLSPPSKHVTALVANRLNAVMLEAKWAGSYAFVSRDRVVEFVWPRESGTNAQQMLAILEKFLERRKGQPLDLDERCESLKSALPPP